MGPPNTGAAEPVVVKYSTSSSTTEPQTSTSGIRASGEVVAASAISSEIIRLPYGDVRCCDSEVPVYE